MDLEAIEADVQRADEFLEGVETVLSRSPMSGLQSKPDSPIWCIPSVYERTMTSLIVYYTFDEDYVWLLSIRKTEAPKGRE